VVHIQPEKISHAWAPQRVKVLAWAVMMLVL
jgi:hypothetical protein